MGNQLEEYAEEIAKQLQYDFYQKTRHITNESQQLVIKPIFWADVFKKREEELFESSVKAYDLHFQELRRFIISYLGDAIAYQPVESNTHNYYRVHEKVRESLQWLAAKAGEDSVLCVISHSLGTVIASNYFYDLQYNLTSNPSLQTPLERGETLSLFYSMGTSLPLWSLRYSDFNRPVIIPPPQQKKWYPDLSGEWINFYDRDDILSFPLKGLNESYQKAVTEDIQINSGNMLTSWNPLSHGGYFTEKTIVDRIINGLFCTWKHINQL
ncbi:chemotaxis protein [Peribacillus deserti]|uniref:Chemotaxis protein n=1 Tax=Peribacillus deserti TaxID=673318 RepID=A0A2N5MAM5_9BACI|nr:chemotaxis protein [Peribacillus deserti]PLT31404.1 chemotaxis protein [Peribacillus deserti]